MNPLEQIIAVLSQYDELSTSKQLLDTFAKYSSNVAEYDLLSKLYHDIKSFQESYAYTKKALDMVSTEQGAYSCRANLSKLCNIMNNPEEALDYLSINNTISPNNPEILMEMVFSLFLLNRKVESEKILRTMKDNILSNRIKYDEKLIDRINFNLGTYDLYKGKLLQGLEGFILNGKKIGVWKNTGLNLPFWDGHAIQDIKTILILGEGGIGDEIINVRFMKHLKNLGMEPIWITNRIDLAEVFNRNGFNTVTDISTLDLSNTAYTYGMSLPIYLKVTETDLWDGPYLTAIDNNISKSKLAVGIKWAGNPLYEHELHRSITFEEIYNAVNSDKYDIFSLQRDDGKEDSYGTDVIQIPELLDTWENTLSTINSLDIVVTSCTSIAHASASIGKRTFVLVPISAYYIWASTHDESSIWYGDNVTVLRQTTHKCWKEPLTKLSQYLNNF